MIAGPNGSGKTTSIRQVLKPHWLGCYINPDDMEARIRSVGSYDLASLGIATTQGEIQAFFLNSPFLASVHLQRHAQELCLTGTDVSFGQMASNSSFAYFVSVFADFVRRKMLQTGASFTFETVMSSYDKVELLAEAKRMGYRTYLYFVATEDPEINVQRVRQRVQLDGHPVPEVKIRERYSRSLSHLMDAIKFADRAYLFDNSGPESVFIAEVKNDSEDPAAKEMEIHVPSVPLWFKDSVLSKLSDQ